ncbi:hypothetical protein C4D60_Mb05t26660 [Musa balbisiana]|uniref:Aldehyde dehydrogenase domain-containing protein n=1 Tax=Musa balbisiana TaxID=52838 RepID=A0A4S8JZ48_MUSBA|nr:hypothetical protein C4D60_Mb05t26660 [Musa balbisiana]
MAIEANSSAGDGLKLPEIKFTKLFINGCFVDAVSGKTFESLDPRNGEVIANIAAGDKEDVDLAVKAAREAFDHGKWPRMSGSVRFFLSPLMIASSNYTILLNGRLQLLNHDQERGKIMMKYADLIEQHAEELAALECLDAGKLFFLNKMNDVPVASNLVRYYAGAADKIHGETLKLSGEFQGYTLREPIGVVGHIIPWNFPTIMFFFKVAPALAAGCTMLVKPAEQTPLTALYCAHLAKQVRNLISFSSFSWKSLRCYHRTTSISQAGIPDGVLNVVTGFGASAGAAIASHMDVDKVSFTGSTEVGRLVMEAAARSNLKSVSLELGGKSPVIICDDADIDMAVDLARTAIFYNKAWMGEICVAGSRVYVQEGIYDEFVRKIAESCKSWIVGDPFSPHVHQGPQISLALMKVDKKQFEKVLRYIDHGKREGATILTGGKACGEKGFYIEPTIFTDVKVEFCSH